MGFIVVFAVAGLRKGAVDEGLGVGAPGGVVGLFGAEEAEVHAAVELVGFGTGVGDEAFLVEGFGGLHDLVGGEVEVLGAFLLELDGGKGEGLVFPGGFLD